MPHWVLKALAQGAISFLPRSQSSNYYFQSYVTKSLELTTARFEHKLHQCNSHMENYLATRPDSLSSFTVLELGTGWQPVVPVALFLCGASKIYTVDKASLLRPSRVREVFSRFVEYADLGRLFEIVPSVRKDRIHLLKHVMNDNDSLNGAELLKKLGVITIVGDIRYLPLPIPKVNLIVSTDTMEHIPEEVLLEIFARFKRLSSDNTVMSHCINMRDHYVTFDPSITPYNFLKYPEVLWRLFNNSLHYQNRLRIPDYCRIHESTGFKIANQTNEEASADDLHRIRLAKRFRRYCFDDLLVVGTWILSTPKGD